MAGRDTFRRLRPLLNGLGAVFGILPMFLHGWIWRLCDLAPEPLGYGLRYALARGKAAELGDNVLFGRNVTVKHWQALHIGSNVSLHENCFLDALGGIRIGNNVSIAHNSSLISFDHDPSDLATPIKYGPLLPGPIDIAEDVWIAAGVRALRNTRIGPRTVVAANAVIRGTLDGGMIYGGVPARPLKPLPAGD